MDIFIVDGSNFWSLIRALDILPSGLVKCLPNFLCTLATDLEDYLSRHINREVWFVNKIWVSKRVNKNRPNGPWLCQVLRQIERHGWQVQIAQGNSFEADDELVKSLILKWTENAEAFPDGQLLALGSGDGGYVPVLKEVKHQHPNIFIAVVSGEAFPHYRANPQLREACDIFVNLSVLPSIWKGHRCLREISF